jgi:hypothetical protein
MMATVLRGRQPLAATGEGRAFRRYVAATLVKLFKGNVTEPRYIKASRRLEADLISRLVAEAQAKNRAEKAAAKARKRRDGAPPKGTKAEAGNEVAERLGRQWDSLRQIVVRDKRKYSATRF